MDWIEHLNDLDEKINAHIISELDNVSEESQLVKFLCSMARRNIDLFMFGARGGKFKKSSYVDIMKTAIRRQLELNQKTTLPLIKKIDPIINLWSYELKKTDFDEIDKYWAKALNFPVGVASRIKQDTSGYVHPRLPLKILSTLQPEDLAQRIYEDCGGNIKSINYFLERLPVMVDVKEFIRVRVEQLFDHDVQCMMHFGDHFMQLIRTFNKQFVR